MYIIMWGSCYQEYIIKERVSNSSMGHQKWQPQVFLDISVDWVSQHLVARWWLWVALWKLSYGSQSISVNTPVNSREARGLVAVDPY